MRLHRGCEFARLKDTGRRLVSGCLVANWLPLPPGSDPRLGVVTSRKIGSAVVRSRARRLLREAFRLTQPQLATPLTLVLVARASIVTKKLANVQHDLCGVLRRAGLLHESPAPAATPALPPERPS